jgi:hypothetical protein
MIASRMAFFWWSSALVTLALLLVPRVVVRCDCAPPERSAVEPPPSPSCDPDAVTIIDVSRHAPPSTLATLVQLAPGERIGALTQRPDVDAITPDFPGGFADFTIEGPACSRRVIVLAH